MAKIQIKSEKLNFRITTFLTLYNEMNYRKTARLLNMTQPGVTQHIHYLENFYGIKLFEYNGKTMIFQRFFRSCQRFVIVLVKIVQRTELLPSFDIGGVRVKSIAYLFGCRTIFLYIDEIVSIKVTNVGFVGILPYHGEEHGLHTRLLKSVGGEFGHVIVEDAHFRFIGGRNGLHGDDQRQGAVV